MPVEKSTVASHPERAAIEAALARGVPLRELSKKYGLHRNSLARHRKKMRQERPAVFAALAADDWRVAPADLEKLRVELSEGFLVQLRAQFDKCAAVQDAAIQANNFSAFAQTTAQLRAFLIEIGRATGRIADAARFVQVNNFVLSPSFLRLKYALTRAVQDHPEAREAILAALREVEAAPPDEPPRADRLPNAGRFTIEATGEPADRP